MSCEKLKRHREVHKPGGGFSSLTKALSTCFIKSVCDMAYESVCREVRVTYVVCLGERGVSESYLDGPDGGFMG